MLANVGVLEKGPCLLFLLMLGLNRYVVKSLIVCLLAQGKGAPSNSIAGE